MPADWGGKESIGISTMAAGSAIEPPRRASMVLEKILPAGLLPAAGQRRETAIELGIDLVDGAVFRARTSLEAGVVREYGGGLQRRGESVLRTRIGSGSDSSMEWLFVSTTKQKPRKPGRSFPVSRPRTPGGSDQQARFRAKGARVHCFPFYFREFERECPEWESAAHVFC